jgi:hypothetical protein
MAKAFSSEAVLKGLKAEVEARSLRLVASELGISHAFLWDLVRGSRTMSEKTKQKAISYLNRKVA